MNRKRPCYHRLFRSRQLRHDTSVTSAELARHPLALSGLIYILMAATALVFAAWALALVLAVASAGSLLCHQWRLSHAPQAS